jgi:tagaturonate reductase
MGGTPAVKMLREAMVGDEVKSVAGILNGTCNYILTEMEATGRSFADVLAEAQRLGFAEADPGVLVTGDVAPYRERKVRMLNGTHTVSVSAALLCGLETVREAVEHEQVGRFIRRALLDEIVPSVTAPGAEAFAREVLDRFANPYIRHALADITLQGTMKMRVRVVPSIMQYTERLGRAPASLAFGFAAHLLFVRGDVQEARRRAGQKVLADDQAERVRAHWEAALAAALTEAGLGAVLARFVHDVCADEALWGADLGRAPGFADAVTEHLTRMHQSGVPAALEAHLAHHTEAAV